MSHWFLPHMLNAESERDALLSEALALPSGGLPDLSRVQGPDQIKTWLKQRHPDATPEQIEGMTLHYWRLGHNLLIEDTLILPRQQGGYFIGEVSGFCRSLASHGGETFHVIPVAWREPIPASAAPRLTAYLSADGLTEITDEDTLQSLAPFIPGMRKKNASIFRWVAIVTLIFELIYFWPR